MQIDRREARYTKIHAMLPISVFVKVLAVAAALLVVHVGHILAATATSAVYVEKSAYKNVVIEIRDNVPVENCQTILHNVEVCTEPMKQKPTYMRDGRKVA